MAYCTRLDVERVYGRNNIELWADLDNSKDPVDIATAITGALEDGYDEVNSELLYGPYIIPFVVAFPRNIVRLNALISGLMLYDGRQVVSSDEDKCSRQRKEKDRLKNGIIVGRIRLLDPTSGVPLTVNCYSAPFIVSGDEGEVVYRSNNLLEEVWPWYYP